MNMVMKGVEKVGESFEMAIVLSIFVAGINALWGILMLPWGLIGIIFAFVDIFIALFSKSTKSLYLQGNYEKARDNLKILWPLGILFGLIFLGVYFYLIYLSVEELVVRNHLIRDVEDLPLFASPKIPQNKN